MKIIVTPDAKGIISQVGRILAQELPEGAVVVEIDGTLDIPPMSAARLTDAGEVEIVANWIGSGPWFDQGASLADREKAIHIDEYGVDPTTKNWAMTPRPLTKAEIKTAADAEAKAKADAEAAEKAKAEAAEKARIAALTVTDYQLALALLGSGLMTQVEAESYVGNGSVPAIFEKALAGMDDATRAIAKIKIMGAKEIRRDDPIVAAVGAATGKSSTDLDALFIAASAL